MKNMVFGALLSGATLLAVSGSALASAPLGNYPQGSIDRDGNTHIVYQGNDHHIYEIWLDGTQWRWDDLMALSGIPLSHIARADARPMSYVQGGGTTARTAVVYIDQYSHIIELSASHTAWTYKDLTNSAVAGPALGGYVRADGAPVVAYVDNSLGHLRELVKLGVWYDIDLSGTGQTILPNNSFYGLHPWTRWSEGISSIPWGWESPPGPGQYRIAFEATFSTIGLPSTYGNPINAGTYPAGYSGVNGEAIAISADYQTDATYGHIFRQVAPYESVTWGPATDITLASGGGLAYYPATGVVRRENQNNNGWAESVIYSGPYPDYNIYEIENVNGRWIPRNATSDAGASAPQDPIFQPFLRADNVITSIPYQRSGHILNLYNNGGRWYNQDLGSISLP